MTKLSPDLQEVLRVLVRAIDEGRIQAGDPRTYLSYKDVLSALGYPEEELTYNRPLYRKFEKERFGPLVEWTKTEGVPAITGIVVGVQRKRPGPGFFRVYERPDNDLIWWDKQIEECVSFPWKRYLDVNLSFSYTEINAFIKISEGRERVRNQKLRERSRILREAAIRYFSEKNGLRCGICNWEAPSFPLRSKIIEIHHEQALCQMPRGGREISLAEALRHLIPLCPTCHRLIHAKPSGGAFTPEELRTKLGFYRAAVS